MRDLFGPEMLDASGAVDHHRLAERVFSDAAARSRLEAAIHPLVRKLFVRLDAQHGVIDYRDPAPSQPMCCALAPVVSA